MLKYFRFRDLIGPKSILFFVVFCGLLFLSVNWKLSYEVSKDYVAKVQQENAKVKASQLQRERAFDESHRRLAK